MHYSLHKYLYIFLETSRAFLERWQKLTAANVELKTVRRSYGEIAASRQLVIAGKPQSRVHAGISANIEQLWQFIKSTCSCGPSCSCETHFFVNLNSRTVQQIYIYNDGCIEPSEPPDTARKFRHLSRNPLT